MLMKQPTVVELGSWPSVLLLILTVLAINGL